MTTSHSKRASSINAARAAVPTLLDALSGFAPRALPISEREYLARVLDFTAWDGEDLEQLASLERPILFGGTLAERHRRRPIAESSTESLRAEVSPRSALFLRDMFRRHLKDRVAGIHRWNFGQHIYRNMLVLPAHISDRKVSNALAVFLPRDLSTGIEYALALLFDKKRGFGNFLRECGLKTCGGYFLRRNVGGKPLKYHTSCKRQLRAKSRHKKRQKTEEP